MPVIKQDAVAVTRDELHQLRAELARPYDHRVLDRDEQRILFIKSPREEPDPVSDLESCLERVPDAAVNGIHHVILLGGRGAIHMPATTIRHVLERRTQLDRAAVEHLRATLDPQHGITFYRVAGDPAGVVRLGLRIPRTRCLDLTEPDLLSLARSVGPHIDDGSAKNATIGYLVADEDHVRLSVTELLEDLGPRWTQFKRTPAPAPLAPPKQEPVPEPAPKPAPKARRQPKRSIRVRPPIDLEFNADAAPPEVDADQANLNAAADHVQQLLESHNFNVLRNVAHGAHLFALAAERTAGYPHRVLVRTLPFFERAQRIDCLQLVRELEADLLIVIADRIDEDAQRRTVATKVKVVRPRDAGSLRF